MKLFVVPLLFISAFLAVVCLDPFSIGSVYGASQSEEFFGNLSSTEITFIGIGVLVTHVYLAACLQIIAKKLNLENTWLAWIPILQLILLIQAVEAPS
ncbi:MAG: hypothetical protein AUK48_14510 [Oscillatoriales cyanobacterium CG2_30_44_21]|nr:MAG: hypothetical protein AUK48_14510 [Oscillatoriales cyanobacterium CG2_30_44_21]